MILPLGVILPPRLPGGARVHEWLRSSHGHCVPLLSAPIQKILRDRVDSGTLAPQMEPEDVYTVNFEVQYRGCSCRCRLS